MFGKRIGFIVLVSLFTLSSCYKVKETYIMKGEWLVTTAKVDGGTTNLMYSILPKYDETTSEYIVYFGDDDKCTGQYYIDDELNYAVEGTWNLLDKTHIYIELDNYVKGIFELEMEGSKEIIMYADQNLIRFYNIGEVEMVIEATRK